MASAKEKIVRRAQDQGFNFTESNDGWHGSFIYEGQEYTLDNEDAQALLDDFEALAEILRQDDTYSIEYNDDADRYVLSVEGQTETFTDPVLAKAFQKAKTAVMKRQAEQNAALPKDVEPEIIPPKPSTRKKPGNGAPAVEDVEQPEALGGSAFQQQAVAALQGIQRALESIDQKLAVASAFRPPESTFREAEPTEPFVEPEIETPPPAPRKKGLGTSRKSA